MTTYFASGSNRPADIRGFDAIGHAIGVAAPELSENAIRELEKVRVEVFVDSGAFSEVTFGPAGVTVVAPITDADWRERLATYRRLAVALGPRVHLVAPDRIGDQEETLARLARYAPELRELRTLGANILVPIQKGSSTQAAFVRRIVEVLGFDDFVHAIPSKKKATTVAELRAYLEEVRPARLHFLGLGLKNTLAGQVLAACAEFVPAAALSFDSNLIAASVGRGGRAPRRLTAAKDEAVVLLAKGAPFRTSQEIAIVLAFGSDAERAAARAVAFMLPIARLALQEALRAA
jgi:hypothetical protein